MLLLVLSLMASSRLYMVKAQAPAVYVPIAGNGVVVTPVQVAGIVTPQGTLTNTIVATTTIVIAPQDQTLMQNIITNCLTLAGQTQFTCQMQANTAVQTDVTRRFDAALSSLYKTDPATVISVFGAQKINLVQ